MQSGDALHPLKRIIITWRRKEYRMSGSVDLQERVAQDRVDPVVIHVRHGMRQLIGRSSQRKETQTCVQFETIRDVSATKHQTNLETERLALNPPVKQGGGRPRSEEDSSANQT